MNEQEGKDLLYEHLKEYRGLPYGALVALLDQPQVAEVTGPSGTKYQLEVQVFWDGPRHGNVRVLGSIDDGGLRASVPLTDSFIMAPNGVFIGE
jgi:hypothetical protein